METIRAWVEGFLRGRYGYEGPGASFARVLALAVFFGATLVVVGWLLMPLLTIPRFSPNGPVVRSGVVAVMVCGEKRLGEGGMDEAFFERMDAATRYAPESGTGTWGHEERGSCTIFYHHPPGFEQRYNRQQRAANALSGASLGEMPRTEGVRSSAEGDFEKLPVVEKLPRAKR